MAAETTSAADLFAGLEVYATKTPVPSADDDRPQMVLFFTRPLTQEEALELGQFLAVHQGWRPPADFRSGLVKHPKLEIWLSKDDPLLKDEF